MLIFSQLKFIRYGLLISSLLSGVSVFGQDECLRAGISYESKDFRTALYFLNRCIPNKPDSAQLFEMRGICYVNVNKLDSAQHDFEHALQLDSTYASVYFNLGLLFADVERYTLSTRYFKQYLGLDSTGASRALYAIALNYYTLLQDSLAFPYIIRAHNADSTNQNVLFVLMMESMKKKRFDSAIAYANSILGFDQHDVEALEVKGLSLIELGAYQEAEILADEAILISPSLIDFYLLKYRARIFGKTDPQVMLKDSLGEIKFNSIQSQNITSLSDFINENSDEYNSKKLQARFTSDPHGLALDEYFMLYLSQAFYDSYNPYSPQDNKVIEFSKSQQFKELTKYLESKITKEPLSIRNYYALANAFYALGNYHKFDYYYNIYYAFVMAIQATGSGLDQTNAMIVISPHDEYMILGFNDLSLEQQSLEEYQGHYFDVMKCKNEDGKIITLYFNIDHAVASLVSTTNDKNSKKKRRQ